jgi:hypothetical protein
VEALNPALIQRPSPSLPAGATDPLLGHLVALEAVLVLSGCAPSSLGGRVQIEDLVAQESSLHTLVRIPWCKVCGEA